MKVLAVKLTPNDLRKSKWLSGVRGETKKFDHFDFTNEEESTI